MASLALEDVAARIFTHCLPVCSAAFVKVLTWLPRIAWAPNAPAATLHKSFSRGSPVSRCGIELAARHQTVFLGGVCLRCKQAHAEKESC